MRQIFQTRATGADVRDAILIARGLDPLAERDATFRRHVSGATPDMIIADAMRSASGYTPENDAELMREAVSGGTAGIGIVTAVNTIIEQTFNRTVASSTTRGWVKTESLDNFLSASVLAQAEGVGLRQVPRGGRAESYVTELAAAGSIKLARFAREMVVDETDLIDAATSLNGLLNQASAMGAAAGRLGDDLVYSIVLQNPTLADEVALFDASTRGNLDTSVLGSGALGEAWGKIAAQVEVRDDDAEGETIHQNRTPKYLIVPAQLLVTAQSVLASLYNGEVLVEARSESRIGPAGLLDPRSKTKRAGTTNNWLLACDAEQSPSILLGYLNGRTEPRIESFDLDKGQWGKSWTVSLDIAGMAMDGRGLYWSTGTGG